jgi:purine-nucleoside phosphorylase
MSNFTYFNELSVASEFVSRELGTAEIGLVLGSGLAGFTKYFSKSKAIPFKDIPGMPKTTVHGHSGDLIMGEIVNLNGHVVKVLCFSGRVHAYEGWKQSKINFLCRLAMMVGCKVFILTNSAGGCLQGMQPGSIMVIRDYLRFASMPVMQDLCEDQRFGPRELNTRGIFSDYIAQVARDASKDTGIEIHEGIYCWTSGPTYETPAEVQAGIRSGVGAFGMSTVPEALATAACGMELFGISLATNLAAGLFHDELTHEDVTKVARECGPKFEHLLLQILKKVDLAKVKAPVKPSHHFELKTHQFLHERNSLWPQPYHVQKDCEFVKNLNQNSKNPVYLFYALCQASDIIDGLENVRILPLKDIPFFSQIAQTPAACNGYFIFGNTKSGQCVLTLSADNRCEGFNNVESFYLFALSRMLGVQCILSSIPSIKADEKAPEVLLLNDFVDRSDHCLPPNLASFRYLQKPSVHLLKLGSFNKKILSELSAKYGFSASEGALLSYPGPSLPSPAETACAALAKCAAVATSGLTFFAAANAFGIPSIVFAPLMSESEYLKTFNGKVNQELALTYKFLLQSLNIFSFQEEPALAAREVLDPNENLWLPNPRAMQENFSHVEEAAQFLRTFLNNSNAKTALFVEGKFASLMSELSVISSVKCAQVPHWSNYCNFPHGLNWTVSLTSLPKDPSVQFLVFNNPSFSSESAYSMLQMTLAVRVSLSISLFEKRAECLSLDAKIPWDRKPLHLFKWIGNCNFPI